MTDVPAKPKRRIEHRGAVEVAAARAELIALWLDAQRRIRACAEERKRGWSTSSA